MQQKQNVPELHLALPQDVTFMSTMQRSIHQFRNRSAPVETILTKEEIGKMIQEREENLKDTNFPNDAEVEKMDVIVIKDEPVEAEFPKAETSTEEQLESAPSQNETTTGEEGPTNAVIDVDDEYSSFAVNFERLQVHLEDYPDHPAFTVDDQGSTSRFLLFKIADNVVNAYPPWKQFMFDNADQTRVDLLKEGKRHASQEMVAQQSKQMMELMVLQ